MKTELERQNIQLVNHRSVFESAPGRRSSGQLPKINTIEEVKVIEGILQGGAKI